MRKHLSHHQNAIDERLQLIDKQLADLASLRRHSDFTDSFIQKNLVPRLHVVKTSPLKRSAVAEARPQHIAAACGSPLLFVEVIN